LDRHGEKKYNESKPLHPDGLLIWKKAIVKYEFKPMKCPKVDCCVKESQSDDGCDDHNKSAGTDSAAFRRV
jgi:hypothetical protein